MYNSRYYIHKYSPGIFCKTVKDTARGYKVKQTSSKKVITAFYDDQDFNGPHAFWMLCNSNQVPTILTHIK